MLLSWPKTAICASMTGQSACACLSVWRFHYDAWIWLSGRWARGREENVTGSRCQVDTSRIEELVLKNIWQCMDTHKLRIQSLRRKICRAMWWKETRENEQSIAQPSFQSWLPFQIRAINQTVYEFAINQGLMGYRDVLMFPPEHYYYRVSHRPKQMSE